MTRPLCPPPMMMASKVFGMVLSTAGRRGPGGRSLLRFVDDPTGTAYVFVLPSFTLISLSGLKSSRIRKSCDTIREPGFSVRRSMGWSRSFNSGNRYKHTTEASDMSVILSTSPSRNSTLSCTPASLADLFDSRIRSGSTSTPTPFFALNDLTAETTIRPSPHPRS